MNGFIRRFLPLLSALLISIPAFAQDFFKVDGIWYHPYVTTTSDNMTDVMVTNDWNWFAHAMTTGDYGEGCYSGDIKIPEYVTYEGKSYKVSAFYDAFLYSKNLKSLSIPKTIDKADCCFVGCDNLQKIEIDPDNPVFVSKGNVVFSKDMTVLCAVPSSVAGTDYTVPEGVTEISATSVFAGSKKLLSVTFPKSLRKMYSYSAPFVECDNLVSINVNAENQIFASTNGALCFKDGNILQLCYVPNGVTGHYIVPDNITTVCADAFYGSKGITRITFPQTLSYLSGGNIVRECSNLTEIDVQCKIGFSHDSNNNTLKDPFPDNPNLERVNVSESANGYTCIDGVTYSGSKLIYVPSGRKNLVVKDGTTDLNFVIRYRSWLKTLDIPASVTVSTYHAQGDWYTTDFDGLTDLETLFLRGDLVDYHCLKNLNAERVTLYMPTGKIEAAKKYFKGCVLPLDVTDVKVFMRGFEFKVADAVIANNSASIKVAVDGVEVNPDAQGVYRVTGLNPNTSYNVTITGCAPFSITTKEIKASFSNVSATQTTLTLEGFSVTQDETARYSRIGYRINGKTYEGDTKLTNLVPNTKLEVVPFAVYGDREILLAPITCYTEAVSVELKATDITPTGIRWVPTYDAGDAKVTAAHFITEGIGTDGRTMGLAPNTSYTVKFQVECEGGYTETRSVTAKTQELTLETLQPRCVSDKCAIVAADTNISEYETGAGFQWKKYDAPASLDPSEAYAAVYDGMLEGYIKNLQPTSYYNVRAFYKDAAGKYYYGEWVTFDPSDFSFFEPTVHTYPVEEVRDNSATVRGYVLQGTDEITGQGFEYWELGAPASEVRRAPAQGVMTAEGFGQVMQVVLSDLKPGTEYGFRSYVQTTGGTTYGEEQTFVTTDLTSVGEIESPAEEVTIVGYYDVMGRMHLEPVSGLNIVLYSDGSARKIMRR